jgi:hypothetical protein
MEKAVADGTLPEGGLAETIVQFEQSEVVAISLQNTYLEEENDELAKQLNQNEASIARFISTLLATSLACL